MLPHARPSDPSPAPDRLAPFVQRRAVATRSGIIHCSPAATLAMSSGRLRLMRLLGWLRPLRRQLVGGALATSLLLGGLHAPVARAASLSVTTLNDTVDAAACSAVDTTNLPGPDGVVSLREAICAANTMPGDDTITIDVPGTIALTGAAREDANVSGDLDIVDNGELIIIGNLGGTTIDGNKSDRLFDLRQDSVLTLDGLTLTNGSVLYVKLGNQDGGAIYADTATLTVRRSTIENGLAYNGGAIGASSSTIAIDRSTLSNNIANQDGGGIYVNSSDVTVDQSTLMQNTSGSGGALSIFGGTLDIFGSTLSSNQAQTEGGALYLNDGVITLGNSTFSANTVGTKASGLGGAIQSYSSDIDSNNVTYVGNQAFDGGVIALGKSKLSSTITFHNSLLVGNTSISTKDCLIDPNALSTFTTDGNNMFDGDGRGCQPGKSDLTLAALGKSASDVVDPIRGNNGGPTQTHALVFGGPAVNAGSNALVPSGTPFDQRGSGYSRIVSGIVDIGAYELQGAAPLITSAAPPAGSYGGGYSHTFVASGAPAASFTASGSLPPGLTLTAAGVLSGTPTAAGSYPNITVTASNSLLPDATQTFTLTIARAPLTVTANDASRTVGAANPAFSARYSGFVGGDGASALGGALTLTAGTTPASPVGSYPIVPGGLTSGNYAIVYVNGTLTVSRAAVYLPLVTRDAP